MDRDWNSETPTISAHDTTLSSSPNVNLTTPIAGWRYCPARYSPHRSVKAGPRSIGAVCPQGEARGGGRRTPRFRDPRRFRHNLAPASGVTLPNRVATSCRPSAGNGLLGRDSRKRLPSLRNSAVRLTIPTQRLTRMALIQIKLLAGILST